MAEENKSKIILVVDDDKANLIAAKNALGSLYKIAAAPSGEKALDFLKNNTCDLVLLDLIMPVMDGFEVLEKIRAMPECSEIPVIFLTGDRNAETENKCLKAGAVDYIQKPFAVDVLRARIGRILELFDLRNHLQQKVLEKTEYIENLNGNIIRALAHTIDAKDRYTSGHSQRVAGYSREIAKRAGKSEEEQKITYYAGLLHDVGKIRVPEEVINKPGKLTEEEFSQIKLHPIASYHILRDIYEDKTIADGAKFHHERYDGGGYPNGLKGENIPEVARIIGVADAYDAMASNRSYRNALPQEVVRSEIEKGRGRQFDPGFADVMLKMIDEDTEYRMCELESAEKTILVADDEEVIHKMVKSFMESVPTYKIICAPGGLEAVKLVSEKHIDLILLDIKMPEMDGFDTLKKIREISDVPVVFLTGDKDAETIAGITRARVEDYITKPFLPAVLREVIHSVLNG